MGISKTYVPVADRIKLFKEEHGIKGSIETETNIDFKEGAAIVKATIKVDGKILAQGQSFAFGLDDEKSFEKAETVAVGRALAFAGYEADNGVASAEEMEAAEAHKEKKSSGFGSSNKSKPSSNGGGFGSMKKAAPKAEVVEEEDEVEEESEEEVEEQAAAPKASNGNGKAGSSLSQKILNKYSLSKN